MSSRQVNVARSLAILAAGAGLGMAAPPVRADVVAQYVAFDQYIFEVTHLPDLDQRRGGLPGNGVAHSVPTAFMDWMCYFAAHGIPSLPPGPGPWTDPASYGPATTAILNMGAAMGTDPVNGTNGVGLMQGLAAWTAGHPIVVFRTYTQGAYAPTFDSAASHVFRGGHVVVTIGWYESAGDQITRDGGHTAPLARGMRGPRSGSFAGLRDPWTDEGDLGAQSMFSTELYVVEEDLVRPTYAGTQLRPMSRVAGYGTLGYIDVVTALYPQFALTVSPDRTTVRVHYAFLFDGAAGPAVHEHALPAGVEADEMVLMAGDGAVIYLDFPTDPVEPAQPWRLDLLTGVSEQMDTPVDPYKLLAARRRGMYVLDEAGDLVLLDIDVEPVQEIVRTTPTAPAVAMTMRDATDELIALSVDQRQILAYPYHLDGYPLATPVPPEVPLGENASLAWNEADQSLWIASAATTSLWRLTEAVPGQLWDAHEIADPVLDAPTDPMDVADDGRVLAVVGGQLIELAPGDGGQWAPTDSPWFNGVQTGGALIVARSRSDDDPLLHTGHAWRDVPPTQTGPPYYDCDADVTGNNQVDVDDLTAVILAWAHTGHAGFIPEDVIRDGAINVDDLIAVILAWGPCP